MYLNLRISSIMITKKICIILSLFCLGLVTMTAQNNKTIISGTVIENSNSLPIEFATVFIADTKTKKPITGTTTDEKGKFKISSKSSNFYIEVRFIGFKSKIITDFKNINNKIELGKIVLSEDSSQLEEVVVRAEKSQTVFKLDKRIFNVGKDLSTAGASALEVLDNIPSVNVNIEGEISLRGSTGVQMLINGKPSVLTDQGSNALGTITADMIARVEVITNPSAKYDAEGTSGILNIVLKKNEKKGVNGSISVNVGTPQSNSIGVSLNKRTEKFNLFTQFGLGRRTYPGESIFENNDFVNNTIVRSNGQSEKNETFYNILLGTDYHINNSNVLTLSGSFAYEVEDENSTNLFTFSEANIATKGWTRKELTEATNPKWQYEFQYKKDFKDHEDHNLLFSAQGSFFGKDQSSNYDETTTLGVRDQLKQKTATDFKEATYTYKLDYTRPFSKKYILELGSQYILQDVSNNYEVGNLEGANFVIDPSLTNLFDYNQNVLGLYGTLGYEGEKWGVKGGLRLEKTDLKTVLQTTNQKNTQNYTNLFPSAHISYKVSEKLSLQTGYSKRIYRPRLWDLNPFFNIRNNFNIFTGNPNLNPQFSDSYELTSIFKIGKTSFNLGAYHRFTTDVIERVTTFNNGVSTRMPINAGTNNATGIEFNTKYSPFKWGTLTADFNWNTFHRKGIFQGKSLDFNGTSWNSRATAKIKLPADFDLEISGNYRSKVKTIQGQQEDNLFANLGLRKKIFKGKVVANLSIRDLFASRVREYTTFQTDVFSTYGRSQRGRFISLGLSYAFGKGEAMQYSGRRRF